MFKSIVLGLVWFITIYFAVCVLVGAIAGAIAGAADPENASVMGARAGAMAVESYRAIIVVVSIAIAVVGTWFSILPGTSRVKKFSVDAG